MATPGAPVPIWLRVTRTLAADRERVFRAWTDPRAVARWLAPTEHYVVAAPELDLRVGGRYRVEMTLEGNTHIVVGTYREIRPPERLVFSWRWEQQPDRGEQDDTIVTVELFDRGGSTELVLTHEKLPDEAVRQEHEKGWAGCLGQLERFLSQEGGTP